MLLGFLYDTSDGLNDFRELPLIIHLFYLQNPWYLIGTSLLTAIASPPGSYLTSFFMHLVALVATRLLYQKLLQIKLSGIGRGVIWMLIVLTYYLIFLLPTWIVVDYLAGVTDTVDFARSFSEIFLVAKYEIFAVAMITGFYLIQIEGKKELLEQNDKLKIQADTIKKHCEQLSKYAYKNSHEVRAPLSRILSLVGILKESKDEQEKSELVLHLNSSAKELDEIVRSMNDLLTEESKHKV